MRIGIDLGGTKIEGMALDSAGAEIWRQRITTPRGDYKGTIDAIGKLLDQAEAATGAAGLPVGIAIPGAVSPATGLIKNANSTWLIGRPFAADLEIALDRPIRLANDANCFVLSEASDGAGAGFDTVFGVIIGTGTGGGIVVKRQLHEGPHLIAGEWGHVPLPWRDAADGPPRICYCGRTDCIETYLSGPGLALTHRQLGGAPLEAEEIARLAVSGDATARQTLDRYEASMARSLALIINILDPDIIVLGGGVSNVGQLYENIPERLEPYVFSDEVATPIRPAWHGDSSGVRGAAWLWPEA
jgi:fructokinase